MRHLFLDPHPWSLVRIVWHERPGKSAFAWSGYKAGLLYIDCQDTGKHVADFVFGLRITDLDCDVVTIVCDIVRAPRNVIIVILPSCHLFWNLGTSSV